MAYVKLDTGILNSTLWIDRECREIFITALLMGEPFEATEPMPTYEVRSLDRTPFEVPPGWYGFVHAAGIGIIRSAMADTGEGMKALERLAAPDPESRSQEFDGRRLVRVDGGYIILNFFKYRDRDHTAATRSARYRERKKKNATRNVVAITRDDDENVTVTRNITQAVSSKQEAVSSKQEAVLTTQHNTHAPGCLDFMTPSHQSAYLEIRSASRNPRSFDAMLGTIHEPVSGGSAYPWETIGQALLELHTTGGPVTPNGIRAFCRKLSEPERARPLLPGSIDWKQTITET